MITVTLDGVEYTKASSVAKQFGYTADYLGQLCRGKKVNARLVGRSWFINIPSLEAHREKKYQNLPKKKTSDVATPEVVVSEESEKTSDTTSKKYLRRVPSPQAKLHRVIERQTADGYTKHVSVRYEVDDNSLIPKVTGSPKVTLLKVGIAGAESLPVKSADKKVSTLKPQPLPDFALSGALSISEIPDGEYTNVEKEEPSEEETEESTSRDNDTNKVKIKKITTESTQNETENTVKEEVKIKVAETKESKKSESMPVLVRTKHVAPSKPVTMVGIPVKSHKESQDLLDTTPANEIKVKNVDENVKSVPINYYIPATGAVLGVLFGSLLLSAEQVITFADQTTNTAIVFAWSNVANMALILFTG